MRAAVTVLHRAAAAALLALCGCGGHGDAGSPDAFVTADAFPPDAPATALDARTIIGDAETATPRPDAAADTPPPAPACTPPAQLPPTLVDPPASYQLPATCAAPPPACGGALDGTAWQLTSLCRPTGGDAGKIRGVCASAIIGSPSPSTGTGHLIVRGGVLQIEITASATSSVTLPNNCAFCRCSDKEAALVRSGVTGARCSPACGGAGSCSCTVDSEVLIEETGSYTITGTSLTTAAGRHLDYCVADKQLTMTLPGGATAVFTATDPAPRPEICDGRDNDLDGMVDDDPVDCAPAGTCLTVGACAGHATPLCQGGRWSCSYTSTAYEEVETRCDGIDNDCDGMTDELPECREVCDGKDNDGNGVVDDNLTDTPPPCESFGVCAGSARAVCAGAAGWTCAYPASYEAVESRCDGLDNDCDGVVDEACPRCASLGKVALLWDNGAMPPAASACIGAADGTGTPLQVDGLPPGTRTPAVIDGRAGKLYFATVDPLAIRRVGLDGSGLELVASPADFPWSLALDDTGEWLYYSNVSAKEIHRLRLTTRADEVTARGTPAYDLQVRGSAMYYLTDQNGPLVRSNLDGSGAVTLISALTVGWDVDLVGNRIIYHSNSGRLRVADLRGRNDHEIFDPPNVVWRIRADPWNGWIYYLSNFSTHRIRIDGSGDQIVPTSCPGMRELSSFAVGVCVPP
jgi:Domain of unknown function (DUF5050)/Putative metal-binding motif